MALANTERQIIIDKSERIAVRRDYYYVGKERANFISCSFCASFTPFIFYVNPGTASYPLNNVFCAKCLPQPAPNEPSMYRPESIFQNREFLRIFEGYEYLNPYYERYSNVNRIIITENTKIHPEYKTIMRESRPWSARLRLLFSLFPDVHQLPFQRYATLAELCSKLQAKYEEIRRSYDDASLSRYVDNYDMLVERTPLVSRMLQANSLQGDVRSLQERENDGSSPSDFSVARMDPPNSEPNNVSSQELLAAEGQLPMSQSFQSQMSIASSSHNQSSYSVGIISSIENPFTVGSLPGLSQSMHNVASVESLPEPLPESLPEPLPEPLPVPLPESLELSAELSSGPSAEPLTVESSPLPSPTALSRSIFIQPANVRKGSPTVNNSQEAGPSGLRRKQPPASSAATTQRAKRRRVDKPVNPTPAEAQGLRGNQVRLPRLSGG